MARDLETELAVRLERFPELAAAVLFGSRGGGVPRPDSDLDLGVLFRLELDGQSRFDACLRVSAELEDLGRADVVDLGAAPPLLAHRALRGRRLMVRDPVLWVRFVTRTLALAGDERHWQVLAAAARRRRLEEGRFGRP